jgi:predicted  nucleic acid-binding Zn-ribbon protein
LQTLDSQRDAVLARLAEIQRQLSQNEAVRKAQIAADGAQANHLKWKTRAADLELERSQLTNEAKAAEQRLYSGKVLNPRELTDLQDKVANLRKRSDHLDEPLLEAMMEIEQGELDVAAAQQALEQILADQAQTLGALTDEQVRLQNELAHLDADIQGMRTTIPSQNLALYDQLRKRPGGIAVAKMRGDECSSCGVGLTSRQAQQVRHGDVLPCPTCGRILYS